MTGLRTAKYKSQGFPAAQAAQRRVRPPCFACRTSVSRSAVAVLQAWNSRTRRAGCLPAVRLRPNLGAHRRCTGNASSVVARRRACASTAKQQADHRRVAVGSPGRAGPRGLAALAWFPPADPTATIADRRRQVLPISDKGSYADAVSGEHPSEHEGRCRLGLHQRPARRQERDCRFPPNRQSHSPNRSRLIRANRRRRGPLRPSGRADVVPAFIQRRPGGERNRRRGRRPVREPCGGPRPAGRQGDGRGGRETPACFERRSAGVLTGGRRPVRARLPPASGSCAVSGKSHTHQEHPGERRPAGREDHARQRAERSFLRVFPSASWRACQRSISGRSQRLGRPRPRSRTGRGMSGYRRR